MFRNENELLKSLYNAANRYYYPKAVEKEEAMVNESILEPLTSDELAELEKYRIKTGVLDFTKIKDFNTLTRLVENVERKNTIESAEYQPAIDKDSGMKDYVAELVDELLPLMGLKEANVSIATSAGKTKINVKKGQAPEVIYENADENTKTPSFEYTVIDKNDNKNKYNIGVDLGHPNGDTTITATLGTPEFEQPVMVDTNYAPQAEECNCEGFEFDSSDLVVKLFECGGVHNPAYYHAVKYICETVHFPNSGVYGYNEVMPEYTNVALLLPNVWGKISEDDVEFFTDMMEHNDVKVFVVDTEDYTLHVIESPFDLLDYEMTPLQEEVLFSHD